MTRNVTAHQAAQLGCPFNSMKPCIRDNCMAWVWHNDGYEYIVWPSTHKTGEPLENHILQGDKLDAWKAAGWVLEQRVRDDWNFGPARPQYEWVLKRPRDSRLHTGHCSALAEKVVEVEHA